MYKKIKELYNGDFLPLEDCEELEGYEAECAMEELEMAREALLASLSETQKTHFNRYSAAIDALGALTKEHCFTTGFRLGTRITAECFCENE